MRLKRLELQGYKTFAAKTQFAFNGGLTAIVGPNGSGKSNIADAIQWVLGEQSYSLLRAKRSEDMIFGGSDTRARMGMAQATLTLDNTDGWLPVDYGEVVLARRAYRSGENEYYLNNTRVRLRDITELLAHSGLSKRTYTVVGQGLIDQALSLRPNERRSLIEEAAGIAGHQAKRSQALNQLDETRRNLERVQDILQEIAPRLRYLKRQADRAQERRQVSADLEALLRTWYGYRWHRALDRLGLTRQRETLSRRAVQDRQAAIDQLTAQEISLRQRRAQLRNQLGDWHRQSSALHRQAEVVQRELAVGSERLRQLRERRQELLSEVEPLHERRQSLQEQVAAAAAALTAEQASLKTLAADIAQSQAQLDALQIERSRRQQELVHAQDQALQLQGEIAAQERRQVDLESRRQALLAESARLGDELVAAQSRHDQMAPQVAARRAELAQLEAVGQQLVARREALLETIARTESELSRQTAQLAERRRVTDRIQDQLSLLQRLKEEGEGYSGGARSIIRALQSAAEAPSAPRRQTTAPPLAGIIGTVADQLHVPADLELAIETALGGRLQDVIVERWQDAEQAIAWLKRQRGGRATFLPLDALRPGRRLQVTAMPGVVGLAAQLVTAEPRLSIVVDYLLGRVIVTEDLPTARRVLDALRERPTLVTLEGDIVRPGGSISGGSQQRRQDQGVLARERRLRELPGQLAAAQAALAEAEQAHAALTGQLQTERRGLAGLDDDLADTAQQQRVQNAGLAELQGRLDRIAQELQWRQDRLLAVDQERDSSQQRKGEAQRLLAELSAQREAAQQAVVEAEAALARLQVEDAERALTERRAAASVMAQRIVSQQALLANQRRALGLVEREMAHKQERSARLADESATLEASLQALRSHEAALSAQIAENAHRIEPAEAELLSLEEEQKSLADQVIGQREHLQHEEQAHNQAQLALQRTRDELAHLRSEIEHDLGLVELEESDELVNQPPLPLRPLIERLPVVETLPEGTEQEIRRLRTQHARLGSVNPNAPQEYDDALERFDLLTSQANDLQQAAKTLQEVVRELDEVMQREFMITFRAVARQFKEMFTTLFNGGTARLQLSEPDDPIHSGIEIVVRPPGKRSQPLPLLSGGERSLTAAALILSILKVSPPPFCILDEVDAALDEANVERFRAVLREAAQQTDFIIITHNRGTIEAADTIYGVSMGADNASQVLSLHLEERDGQLDLVPA